jgi:hypothetical protein
LNQPIDPKTYAELQEIHTQLRAIQTGAEQRHAEITAKIAENAVRGTTPNPARASNPSQTAQEAVRGTIAGQGATTPQETSANPSQEAANAKTETINQDWKGLQDLSEDVAQDMAERRLDEHRDRNESRQSSPSRSRISQNLRDRYERIISRTREFEQKHPKIAAGVKIGGKGAYHLANLATSTNPFTAAAKEGLKELVEYGVRNIDKKDVETARKYAQKYGKDIRQWIHENKQVTEKQASRLFGRDKAEKPFFERENEKVQRNGSKIDNLKERIREEQNQPREFLEYSPLTEEIRFKEPNHSSIARWEDKIKSHQENSLQIRSSLEYVTSQRAHQSNFSGGFQQHLKTQVIPNAREHIGNYLVGTPQERYDHYLHNAVHHLGEKHFDLSLNPKSGLEFDRFAASRLFQDGYDKKEIEDVLGKSYFRSVLSPRETLPEWKAKEENYSKELIQQYHTKINPISKENETIRKNVAEFQKEAKGRILEGKINPHDVKFQEKLEADLVNRQAQKQEKTYHEVQQTQKEYGDMKGQLPDGKDAAPTPTQHGTSTRSHEDIDRER